LGGPSVLRTPVPSEWMVFGLVSGGIAAAAVGRQVYRYVRSYPAAAEGSPGAPAAHLPRVEYEHEDATSLIPHLDLPDVAMGRVSQGGVLLLEPGLLEQLAAWLPRRHVFARWTLLFCTADDGYSLATLYRKCNDRGALLLLIRDVHGGLFGAHLAHRLSLPPDSGHAHGVVGDRTDPAMHFYGTGETFLFEVLPMGHLPPLLDGSAPPPVSVCAYRWTHSDDFYMSSMPHFFAVGGGGGRYGLCVEEDLQHGRSGACATFGNPPLGNSPVTSGAKPRPQPEMARHGGGLAKAPAPGDDSRWFEIASIEVWSVDDWALHKHHEPIVH